MSWRTVVLSKRAKIEYSLGYMVIRGEEVHRIFMEEVETVMIETTAVSLTCRVDQRMSSPKNQNYFLR